MKITVSKPLLNGAYVTLEIDNLGEVRSALDVLAQVEGTTGAAGTRPVVPGGEAVRVEQAQALSALTAQAAPPAPPAAPEAPASEADAITAMQQLVARHGAEGRTKAIDVLAHFGAARVTELAPGQRADFIARAAQT